MSKTKMIKIEDTISTVSTRKNASFLSAAEAIEVSKCSTIPLRVSHSTKADLDKIIAAISQGSGRKRIKPDAIIRHALGKLKDQDFDELRSQTVSFSEIFNLEYLRHKGENPNINRDEFLGLILLGKVRIKGLPLGTK